MALNRWVRGEIVLGFFFRGAGWGLGFGILAGGLLGLLAAGLGAMVYGMIGGSIVGTPLGAIDGLVAGLWTILKGDGRDSAAYVGRLRRVVVVATVVVSATATIWAAVATPGARTDLFFVLFVYVPAPIAVGVAWFLAPRAARWYVERYLLSDPAPLPLERQSRLV